VLAVTAESEFDDTAPPRHYDGAAWVLLKHDVIYGISLGKEVGQNLVQGLAIRESCPGHCGIDQHFDHWRIVRGFVKESVHGAMFNMTGLR
jgi:hypothetical protein